MSHRKRHFCDETRILLTEKCNFRCIFCHNEGNDKTQHRPVDAESLKNALHAVIENGCRDITFTGGEPLLEKQLLLDALGHIRDRDSELPVTVVTNASLLSEEFLNAIDKLGSVRFNISFHAVHQDNYRRLTDQSHFRLSQLEEKLGELRRRKIPFKMNAVILRSTLSQAQDVAATINFARRHGALSCKLIELLLVKENAFLVDDYFTTESVAKILPEKFRYDRDFLRGQTLRDETGFEVELRKCRCHYGCESCQRNSNRTTSLDSRGGYWACFAKPGAKEPLTIANDERITADGETGLDMMRKVFGPHSPSLNRRLEMTDQSRQVWFQLDSEAAIQDIFQSAKQCIERQFQDIFFEPNFTPEGNSRPILAIYVPKHDPENALLIETTISLEKQDGLFINHLKFPHKKPHVDNPKNLRRRIPDCRESHRIDVSEKQFFYGEARFVVQNISNQLFLFVCVHNEAGWNLAQKLSHRTSLTPVGECYDALMKRLATR